MARPKKGDEIGATMQIGLRISAELRERLDAVAACNGRSLTEEARAALESHVAREERKTRGKP